VRRARDLATADFDTASPALPEALNKLDFDAWRDIRFRPDKAFLAANGSKFRLQLFHLGHLYRRPVTINTLRDGIPTPIPYVANLFDYGRTKIDKPLPVNLGFAGFRLHYPLNSPKVFDEAIAFLGASYFRFLGRGQRYGLSARALAVEAGTTPKSPFFSRILDRDVRAKRRSGDDLRVARQSVGDRRLSFRALSRDRHRHRNLGGGRATQSERQVRSGATHFDVLRW
jgi:Periplasmic glucans biosynthesis protein